MNKLVAKRGIMMDIQELYCAALKRKCILKQCSKPFYINNETVYQITIIENNGISYRITLSSN